MSAARRAVIVLVVLLGWSSSLSAQDRLTLGEAIEFATAASPAGHAADARVEARNAERDALLASLLPDLRVGAVVTDGFPGSGSHLGARGMLGSQLFRNVVAGAEASYAPTDLIAGLARLQERDLAARAAHLEGDLTREAVALVVLDLFEEVLGQELLESAARRRAELLREALLDGAAAVTAGIGTQDELLWLEAAALEAEAVGESAHAAARVARARLVVLTNPRAARAELVLDAGIGSAGCGSPEDELADLHGARAERLSSAADWAWLPRVVLGASLGYAHADEPGYYAVGAAVLWPITLSFAEERRLDALALDARADEDLVRARALELDATLAGLRDALGGLDEQRAALERALAAARFSYEATAARVHAGLAAAAELTEATMRLVVSESAVGVLDLTIEATLVRVTLLGG